MSANNLFLKSKNSGRRQPTTLTCVLVVLFIFGIYSMSQTKNPVKHERKQSFIKEKDIIEAANNTKPLSDEGKALKLDYSEFLKRPESKPSVPVSITPPPMALPVPPLNTKMIVFDDTKNYQSDALVPLGSMVKCLLIHNIVTNNFEAPVIAQVWEDFYFDGKLLLPFGTRIYGTASSGKERDRVMVRFDNIVFQDGKTIKINAMGLSKDGSGGLTGTVIDEHNKQTFIQMAFNFLSGMALGLQQTATNQVTGLSEVEASSRNAILNGAATAFQGEAQRIKTATEQSKGYAIVLAGSDLVVYFQKEADVKEKTHGS